MMVQKSSEFAENNAPLGIICGGGNLPFEIAQEVILNGRKPLLIGIIGEADERIIKFDHRFLNWGQLGTLFKLFKQYGIVDVIFAGSINHRPDYLKIRPDLTTLLTIPKILRSMLGGDNTVIGNVIGIFEQKGIRIIGVQDAASGILAGSGAIVGKTPSKVCMKNISIGVHACKTIGAMDIGQAVICENNRVIAVEGAEGTDAMIERVTHLREIGRISKKGKTGVLIKLLKPGQDERVDLPTIGPETVEMVHRAGLKGIVVDAGRSIILRREECLNLAQKLNIFIFGLSSEHNLDGGSA